MSELRKLATIMAIDVAGYSRAAETDESAAAASIAHWRAKIDEIALPRGGRVFNTAGDGVMLEFPTASAGVEAAGLLRDACAQATLPPIRIGLHLGEVIVTDSGDLLGHGVNVAARLQALAEPGTALVSQAVHAQIHSAHVKLAPLGKVQLDKMNERIEVYALTSDAKHSFSRVAWRRSRGAAILLCALALVGLAGFAGWRALAPQPAAAPARLAVLRFESVGDTETYFAEGMADELISEISRIQGLDVIARTSSFALRGEQATPAHAAQELHATLVLTGSVRATAETIQVRAQLVEADSGRHLWDETFQRPAAEAYPLQRDIALRVARAAGVRVSTRPARRVDPEAFRLYLAGRDRERGDSAAAYDEARAVSRRGRARSELRRRLEFVGDRRRVSGGRPPCDRGSSGRADRRALRAGVGRHRPRCSARTEPLETLHRKGGHHESPEQVE